MKKLIYSILLLFFVSACQAPVTSTPVTVETPAATRSILAGLVPSVSSSTPTMTPIPSPTVDLYAELHVRETALALDKAALDQQAQAAEVEQMRLRITLTSDAATSQAVGTSTALMAVQLNSTQEKREQIAGTPTALVLTQTAYAPTQIAIDQVVRANRFFVSGTRWLGLAFLFVVAALIVIFLFRLIETWQFNNTRMKPNERGQFDIVPAKVIPGKAGNLVNANLQHRVNSSADDLTSVQALANKNYERMKEVEFARAVQPVVNKQNNRTSSKGDGGEALPMQTSNIPISKVELPALVKRQDVLALPDWSMLTNGWDGKKVPYGANVKGLMLADPMDDPHWLIVGRTRTGKSRYGLRTIAASALTMGCQVLFIGKRVDFYPFEGHANAKIVGVDLYNDPLKYFETLRCVAMLMKERDDYLTGRRLSIWQQTGRPQLYVVLDEFSSAVKQLNATKSGAGNLVSSMATALIQEGGKYGINIIQVVQDATGASVDISARRNMGRMVFKVSEQTASDVALGVRGDPSAVGLPTRHFLSVIGEDTGVVLGAAFAPSDDDVRNFLNSRPVTAHEPMDWIDAVATDVTEETPEEPIYHPASYAVDADKKVEDGKKIVALYLAYLNRQEKPSLAEIERVVYGRTGGSFHNNVKRTIAQFEGCTVDELAGLIEQKVSSWQATTQATTQASTTGIMPQTPPLEPVVGK
jgi:hypothetical protein